MITCRIMSALWRVVHVVWNRWLIYMKVNPHTLFSCNLMNILCILNSLNPIVWPFISSKPVHQRFLSVLVTEFNWSVYLCVLTCFLHIPLLPFSFLLYIHTHTHTHVRTHTHTHIYIYIHTYIHICVCVCLFPPLKWEGRFWFVFSVTS